MANSSFPSSLLPGDYLAKELCYYYKYDERKRMIIKQIPGAEPVFFVYDKRDRLVMSQDGVQRSKSTPEWTINKYDDFDRLVFTAILWDDCPHNCWIYRFNNNQDYLLYYYGNYIEILENVWDSYPTTWPSDWTYQKIYEWTDYPVSATGRRKGLLTASRERVIGANGSPQGWLESKFFYDEKGRLIQSYTETDPGGSYIHSQFLLAWNGDLIKQKETHNYVHYDSQYGPLNKATVLLTEHEYDHGSRLTETIYTLSDENDTISYNVDHTYDSMGRLIGSIIDLPGYDQIRNTLNYNIRNWTKNINYKVGGMDYFDLTLGYETNSAAPQFSGNISTATWQVGNLAPEKYDYRYDELSRLTRAYYSPSGYFTTAYQYDLNGNITNLVRRGFSTAGAGNMVLDDLEYSYKTSSNKLSRVDNLAPEGHGGLINFEADGFHNAHLYDYDHNGNMTKDYRRDFSVSYNFLNLPCLIENMVSQQYLQYTYTASGVKLSQKVSSLQKGGEGIYRYYAGPFVYINNELAWINTPEGRIINKNFGQIVGSSDVFTAEFHLRDHLGNTRMVLLAEGVQYSVEDFTDYYPFGMQMREDWEMPSQGDLLTNRYLYNGKEMQDDMGLGWYDYGFRMYDPQISRWNCIDPAAELAHNWSPFRYGFNNPILFNDAYGLWEQTANGWTTTDKDDISRFLSMLQIEEAQYGEASVAQVDQFITEEFNGTGGKLSDGSVLLSGATAYGDGKGNWEIPDYQINRMRNEVSHYSSFVQNHNNFVGRFSFYTYKYYRERSWYQQGGFFPGVSLMGFAAGQASSFLSNSQIWLNLSNMKFYSQNYFGNQHQTAISIANKKGLAKNLAGGIELAGRFAGLYGAYCTYNERQSGKLSNFGAAYIGVTDIMGMSTKPFLGAFSLGTSIGKSIVESNWYFNAVYGKRIW